MRGHHSNSYAKTDKELRVGKGLPRHATMLAVISARHKQTLINTDLLAEDLRLQKRERHAVDLEQALALLAVRHCGGRLLAAKHLD